jgi:hypothetical protein
MLGQEGSEKFATAFQVRLGQAGLSKVKKALED